MHSNQTVAYRQTQKTGMSGREVEAAVLMKAATMLKQCQVNWEENLRDGNLDKALKYNQKLWSLFQVTVADAENPLPEEIKQNILRLSVFVDRRIFEVMAFPAPEKVNIIISINTNIAMGLRGNP